MSDLSILKTALEQTQAGNADDALSTLKRIPDASNRVFKIRNELDIGSPERAEHMLESLIYDIKLETE